MREKKPSNRRRILAEPLEARLLFSATADMVLLDDGFSDVDDLTAQAVQTDLLAVFDLPFAPDDNADAIVSTDAEFTTLLTDAVDTTPPARDSFNGALVFIDADVADKDALIEELTLSTRTELTFVTLDADSDGVEQISLVLAQYSGVKSVHLLSHGSEGRVNLGNTQLSNSNLSEHKETLTQWRDALSEDADILIYGCDLTANDDGVLLIQNIATATGADILASNDDTGHISLGGDWVLESRTGSIETQTLVAPEWHSTLVATVNNDLTNIWHDEVISGNILTGEGGRLVREDTFTTGDPGELVTIEYGGTVYDFITADANGDLTIDADGDTLVINIDGSYTYTTNYSSMAYNADTGWGNDFTFYGYAHGTSYLTGGQLDLTLADANVTEDANGLSVDTDISDRLDNDAGNTEALVVDLNANRGYARVTTSNLSESESVTWTAYDENGNYLEEGTFQGVTGGGASDYSIQAINTASDFRYLVFTVPTNGGELNIYEIRIADAAPANKAFTYTASDTDASTDTGTFAVNYFDDNYFPTLSVDGALIEGGTLSTVLDEPDEVNLATASYEWLSSSDGETWTTIAGANQEEYIVEANQGGNYIRVVTSYVDGEGTHEIIFAQTATTITASNIVGTASLTGTAGEGETLAVVVDDPDGTTTSAFSYQWQVSNDGNNWSDINGASNSTLDLDETYISSYVRTQVQYTDDEGTTESITSSQSDQIVAVNAGAAVNLSGTQQEDAILSASIDDPDGYSGGALFTWERSDGSGGWTSITAANGTSYTLTDDDVGYLVRVNASYTDDQSFDETVTATTSTIVSFNDGQLVELSGTEAEYGLLTATINDPDGPGVTNASYTWQRSDGSGGWLDIVSGIDNTYTLSAADADTSVRVVASYTDAQNHAETNVIAASGVISAVNDGSGITLSGVETEGELLTATITDPDPGTATGIAYVWQRSADGTNWNAISGATAATYTLTDTDANQQVRVVASYTDGQNFSESNVVDTTGVITSVNSGNGVTLTGTETENQVITASIADPDAGTPTAASYRWERSTDGTNWVAINGATAVSYTLTDADATHLVRVLVDYTDGQGHQELDVTASTGVITSVNNGNGVTLSGTETEGQTLTANIADPDAGTPTAASYQWQRSSDGTNWITINGATTNSYTLTDTDANNLIRVVVDYTDGENNIETGVTAVSALISPANSGSGLILSGTEQEGQTLTATINDPDAGSPSNDSYSWERSTDNGTSWIAVGANGSSYTLTAADANSLVRAVASYTDGQGFVETNVIATSGTIATFNNGSSISFTGIQQEGATLTAAINDPDGYTAGAGYLWERSSDGGINWSVINGVVTESYTLTAADTNTLVRITADYTDDQGHLETGVSSTTGIITATNDGSGVSLSGVEQEDQTLTANIVDPDGYTGGATFTWQRSGDGGTNWSLIAGASSSSYTLSDADVGQSVRVNTTYTDDQGYSETALDRTGLIGSVNDTSVLTLTGTATENEILTASVNDADGTSSPITYTWHRSTDNTSWSLINGADAASYTLVDADVGQYIRASASYTDDQNTLETPAASTSGPVTGVNDGSALTLSGTPIEDATLTASVVDVDGTSGSITYLWQRSSDGNNWNTLQGTTANTYALADADVGQYVRVTASYTDDQGNQEAPSATTATPVGNLNDPGVINLTGINQEDQILTASVNDADGISSNITYQWQRSTDSTNWITINGAAGSNYQLTDADVGQYIRATATYSDDQNTTENLTSTPGALVTNVNDAPQLQNPVVTQQAREDTFFRFTFADNVFYDPDGDPLTYSARVNGDTPLPAWLDFDAANRTFSGTPQASDSNINVELIASDPSGQSISTFFMVGVEAANDAPTTTGLPDITVLEDTPRTVIDLTQYFADEETASDNLAYSVVTNSNSGLFNNVSIDQGNGQLQLTYRDNLYGEASITLRATDEQGLSVETTFSVNVTAVNDRPTAIGSIDNITRVSTGTTQQASVSLEGLFTDTEDGNNLRYSIAGNSDPGLVQFSLDTGNNTLTLSIAPSASGSSTLMVRATDSAGDYVDIDFAVTVTTAVLLPETPVDPELQAPEAPNPNPSDDNITKSDTNAPGDPVVNTNNDIPRSNTPAVENSFTAFLRLANNLAPAPEIDTTEDYSFQARTHKFLPEQVLELNAKITAPTSAMGNLISLQSGMLSDQDIADFNNDLVKLRNDMKAVVEEQAAEMAVYKGLTISVTTGLLIWAMRAGSFLLTLFSMIPIWRGLDPLPVIANKTRKEEKKKQKRDKTDEDKRHNEVGYLFDKKTSGK